MGVSVKQLLEHTKYNDFHCITSEADVNRIIKQVHIAEDLENLEWLKKGDFILTTASIYKDNPQAFLRSIQALNNKHCSGIGVNMGYLFNDVFKGMITKTKGLRLPIILLAGDLPLAEVCSMINREIFINTPNAMDKIYNEYSTLSRMVIAGEGLGNIASTLSEYVDKQIIITDEDWNTYFRNYSTRKTPLIDFNTQLLKQSNRENLQLFSLKEDLKVTNIFMQVDSSRFNCLIWKLGVETEVLGYLIITEERESLTMNQYALVESLLTLISFSFYKSKQIENITTRRNNDFGYDFINNFLLKDFTNISDIRSRCELYKFDYSKNRICIVLDVKKANKKDEEIDHIVEETWNKYCLKDDFHTYIIRYLNNIIVFMLDEHNQNGKDRYEAGKLLVEQIFQELLELDIVVRAGVSNYCTGYLSITRAFKQAEETIYIGSRVKPERRLLIYNDYILYHILIKAMSKAELEEIYEESWKVIDEYDKDNHMNFAETLETYLHCNMNAAETAEKLYIHRNTVLYRISKIMDLLQVKNLDSEQSLFLLIGLTAKNILFKVMQ